MIAKPITSTRITARVGPNVGRKLLALDLDLAATIPRVLESRDDEAIHDMRVAIRRLRTLLKLARSIYGRFHADAMRRAFTEVQRATGNLRDEEVLDETLEGLACTDPAFVAWRASRKARERRLRRAVIERIRAGDLDRARAMLRGLLLFPLKPGRNKSLAKFARRAVDRARKSVDAQRDVAIDDVIGMHDLRIAYKELRYTSELFADALPADLAAVAAPAAQFQKRLGEVHDIDMALTSVARARALPPDVKEALANELRVIRAKKTAKYVLAMKPAADEIDPAQIATSIAKPPNAS